MEQEDFILHGRFHVRPTVRSVSDTLLQSEVRLEPRLMALLCILSEHAGQLVTREHLVREVWDNYGGGEDGLTYAISSLRKVLHDSSRELIETIPKKGYILHAEIAHVGQVQRAPDPKYKGILGKPALQVAVCLLLAMSVCAVFLAQSEGGQEVRAEQMEVPFSEVNGKAEETWDNTITTVGEDSTLYKLKATGDRRPEFYVNGRLLSPDEMEGHLDLIHHLHKKLKERSMVH